MVTSGCATIFDGSSQPVSFDSSPKGARIFVNGVEVGTTPLSMQMSRSKSTMILAKKDGYEDQQLALRTKINGNFWVNIMYGGVVGSTVDYFSDAMIEYSPNEYYISLNRIPILQSREGGFAVERGGRVKIEQESIRTERQVRGFILRNHANLTADISRGQGEYLSSLYTMLQLPESAETLKRFRSIAKRYQEPLPFAEVILFENPVDAPAAPSQGQRTNQGRR
jgi:hypothetical protein